MGRGDTKLIIIRMIICFSSQGQTSFVLISSTQVASTWYWCQVWPSPGKELGWAGEKVTMTAICDAVMTLVWRLAQWLCPSGSSWWTTCPLVSMTFWCRKSCGQQRRRRIGDPFHILHPCLAEPIRILKSLRVGINPLGWISKLILASFQLIVPRRV